MLKLQRIHQVETLESDGKVQGPDFARLESRPIDGRSILAIYIYTKNKPSLKSRIKSSKFQKKNTKYQIFFFLKIPASCTKTLSETAM